MAEYIDRATLYAELDSKLDGRPMEDTVPWLTCMGIVRKFPAADVVERTLFDERMAEYQEALDKANEN